MLTRTLWMRHVMRIFLTRASADLQVGLRAAMSGDNGITMMYLIYGANGYTGELIAREAVARGHAPILGGRNAAALARLAAELKLSYRVFALEDPAAVDAGLSGVSALLHSAGPFKYTSRPLIDACLRTGVHYLDITGDPLVLEAVAQRDAEGRARMITLLPGVGFDVVPTDCLAAHLKRRLPSASALALGFSGIEQRSRGSALGTLERLGKPGLVRRGGQLTEVRMAANKRVIDFGAGPKTAVSIAWGDVCTAYYSTGIADIEVFMAASFAMRATLHLTSSLAPLVRSRLVQSRLKARVLAGPSGPDAAARASSRTYLWGEASDAATGQCVVSRIAAPNAYSLTVSTALEVMQRLFAQGCGAGFQTPSTAFGPDFILDIPGIARSDD
jgi:short subunit dehydrogenase-like uncharacterized protein